MNGHEIALWSAVASFFGSLLTLSIFTIFTINSWVELFGAFLIAFITGGSVYAKQRLDDAKEKKLRSLPTTYQKTLEETRDNITKRGGPY